MEGEHIRSINTCVKKSAFLYLESNIQWHTILIACFTVPSESINCTKVKFSLISFRISKVLFLIHVVRLYLSFYSPFIFLLSDIIELSKWIIFLQFYFSRINDYSTLFTRAVTSLLSLIQLKADNKLYFSYYFLITNWYSKYLKYFCIITPKFSLIQFLIGIWFTCHELI